MIIKQKLTITIIILFSVSLLLTYKKCKILLCGDMNSKYEKEFLEYHKTKNLNAHIFKANHHGSQDFSIEFLRAVSPSITVVSSGDQPDYGHPRGILLGSIGKYAPIKVERPILFCTEVASTYKQIKLKQLEEESTKKMPNVYEKAIYGLNVRSDGEKIFAGRVYAGKKSISNIRRKFWDWELYKFSIDNDCFNFERIDIFTYNNKYYNLISPRIFLYKKTSRNIC